MRITIFPLLSLLRQSCPVTAALLATQPGKDPSPTANISACKLPALRSVDDSIGFNSTYHCVPSTGTLNALMLFVDFPDCPAGETAQSLYDFFLPQAADWYRNASYGRLRLNVTADTTRFCRMSARADSYHWSRGLTTATQTRYIQDALAAYNQTTFPPDIDVLYIVVTAKAKPITASFTSTLEVRTRSGTRVARMATTFGTTLYSSWGYKSLNHETGHTMCLPDLYPLPSGRNGLYTGGFDLMGLISGPAPDFFAWDKWRLGWLDDTQVECVSTSGSTTHTLTPLEKTGGLKAVVVRRNSTTALVAELRTAAGVDVRLCAPGVLLYMVSTATASGKGPIRVLDTTPGSSGCAGDKLNDAPLSWKGTESSFTVSDWGVNIALTDQTADFATIRVDVPV